MATNFTVNGKAASTDAPPATPTPVDARAVSMARHAELSGVPNQRGQRRGIGAAWVLICFVLAFGIGFLTWQFLA